MNSSSNLTDRDSWLSASNRIIINRSYFILLENETFQNKSKTEGKESWNYRSQNKRLLKKIIALVYIQG